MNLLRNDDNFKPMPQGPMWNCDRCSVWNELWNLTCWHCHGSRGWRLNSFRVVPECLLSKLVRDLDHVEVCSICLDECDSDTRIGNLRCGHVFHIKCISKWANSRRMMATRCPYCKQEMNLIWAMQVNMFD